MTLSNATVAKLCNPARPSAPCRSRRLGTTALLVSAAFLGACHDPKAASKGNFAKALTAFFDRTCLILSPDPSVFAANAFPATVREFTPVDYGDSPRYEALAQVGLLKRTPVSSQMYPTPVQSFVFDLTAKGRTLYKPTGAFGPGSPGGFCAGRLRVISVDQFTNPVVQAGQRVSQVTFTELGPTSTTGPGSSPSKRLSKGSFSELSRSSRSCRWCRPRTAGRSR